MCVALVEYTTRLGRIKRGVCSQFLCDLVAGDIVACFVRRGSFPTPQATEPLLLIGPGTGVAPMRAFLQERYGRYAQIPPPEVVDDGGSKCMMFFGCRSAESDYLYAQEWKHLCAVSPCQVHTAFSREGPTGSRRCYVTHLLQESGRDVWELIQQVRR